VKYFWQRIRHKNVKPILIVDDEPIVRESLRDWLIDAGYQVITAESGEEAIGIIEQGDIDIMILDIRLPGRSGISVLREVREKKPNIKTIIITAYPSSELTAQALGLGMTDYLIKPVAPDALEGLIREALEKHSD